MPTMVWLKSVIRPCTCLTQDGYTKEEAFAFEQPPYHHDNDDGGLVSGWNAATQTTNIGRFADDVAQEAVHVKSKTEQHRSIQHRPAIGQGTVVHIVVSFQMTVTIDDDFGW